MSTSEVIVVSVEATLFAGAVLAVAREAVKRPWVKFSCSVSFGILPADKRGPAPPSAPVIPAGEAGGIGASPASPAAGDRTVRPAA